jgi:hypothetical protein
VIAAPMMNATARPTTLYSSRNCLNSANIPIDIPITG